MQPIHPLPLPPTLQLTTPASLEWWRQTPTKEQWTNAVRLLHRCPVLTVRQFLALALERHPAAIASETLEWARRHLGNYGGSARLRFGQPSQLSRVWAWQRKDMEYLLDWDRVRHHRWWGSNPVLAAAAWWPQDRPMPASLLFAAMTQDTRQLRHWSVVKLVDRLRRAGCILSERERRLPFQLVEHRDEGRLRVHGPSLDHHCLAVDVALSVYFSGPEAARIRVMHSHPSLASDSRRRRPVGTHIEEASADIEIETADARLPVELVSDNYTNAKVTAKRELLDRGAVFAATSPRVARRVAALLVTRVYHA